MGLFHAVNHIGFAVSDLDRSIDFYTKLFGYPPYFKELYEVPYIGEMVGYPGAIQYAAFFELPGQPHMFLELIQYLNPPAGVVSMEAFNAGNAHLCLTTTNLNTAYCLIESMGGTPRAKNVITSDFGVYSGTRCAFFRDLDGITIQVVEIPKGLDPSGRKNHFS
jgi:catechol 2,3-dioxygenase-like lactoylglutathione lyase family enzyme